MSFKPKLDKKIPANFWKIAKGGPLQNFQFFDEKKFSPNWLKLMWGGRKMLLNISRNFGPAPKPLRGPKWPKCNFPPNPDFFKNFEDPWDPLNGLLSGWKVPKYSIRILKFMQDEFQAKTRQKISRQFLKNCKGGTLAKFSIFRWEKMFSKLAQTYVRWTGNVTEYFLKFWACS